MQVPFGMLAYAEQAAWELALCDCKDLAWTLTLEWVLTQEWVFTQDTMVYTISMAPGCTIAAHFDLCNLHSPEE